MVMKDVGEAGENQIVSMILRIEEVRTTCLLISQPLSTLCLSILTSHPVPSSPSLSLCHPLLLCTSLVLL
jgi:hypothetical protein